MSVPRWQITRFTSTQNFFSLQATVNYLALALQSISSFVEFLLWRKLIFIENFKISCSINCSGWQMSCWGWGERWCWGVTLVSWSRLNLKLWDCEEKGWNPENFVKILVFVNKTDRHQWHWQRVMREPRWDTSNKTGAWCGGEILKLAVIQQIQFSSQQVRMMELISWWRLLAGGYDGSKETIQDAVSECLELTISSCILRQQPSSELCWLLFNHLITIIS